MKFCFFLKITKRHELNIENFGFTVFELVSHTELKYLQIAYI